MKLFIDYQNGVIDKPSFDPTYIQNQDGTAYLYIYGVPSDWKVQVTFTRDDKHVVGPLTAVYDEDPEGVYCHIKQVPSTVLTVPKGLQISAGLFQPQGTTPETYVLWTTVRDSAWIYPSNFIIIPEDLTTEQYNQISVAIGNLTTLVNNNIIQIRLSGDYIQWKYTVASTWNNLVPIGDITGPTGAKGVSMRMKGDWNKDTAYYSNADYLDIVHYAGTSYYCKLTIETSDNQDPLTDTTHWGVFVEQGTSFRMRGEWNTDTPYYVDDDHIDVVTYQGDAYYCKLSITTTGNTSPLLDTTHWGIYTEKGVSFRAKGQWQSGTQYYNNNDYIDVVEYGGKAYYCILSISGTTNPFIDTAHWAVLLDGTMQTSKDTVSTSIGITLEDGQDKTFTQATITSIAITLPVSIGHGFHAAVNFKSGASPVAVNFTNDSAYTLKKMQYGINLANYTPSVNKTVILMFYCDGINLYCYINEVE